MALDHSNPAGRLYLFFKRAGGLSGGTTKVHLGKLFGVPEDDLVSISHILDLLHEETNQAMVELSEIDGVNLEIYSRPFNTMREAIHFWLRGLDRAWEPRIIHKINLDLVEASADILVRAGKAKSIEKAALEKLLAQVQKFKGEVQFAVDLPKELIKVILDHLTDIEEAINLYPITGVRGIEVADEEAFGSFYTNSSWFLAYLEHPTVQAYRTIIRDILSLVGTATLLENAKELTQKLLN